MFNIEEELKKLPVTPGVYMHKDSLGEVIYVGKAVNLRNRVRSYFRKQAQNDPKVRALVSNIAEFEYIRCATEMEALVLECNLIKKFRPRYNVLLKDDKAYPYIVVTMSEKWPRVIRTRRLEHNGNKYFGPYTDVACVGAILDMIKEMYPLKKCRAQSFPAGVRPCLNYFIGKCEGVCQGEADHDEYMRMIDDIISILNGKDAALIKSLEAKMNEAAEELEYEEAARYRDYITALRRLGETQRAAMLRDRDADVLIPIVTAGNSIVAQYKIRDGKLSGREVHYLTNGSDEVPVQEFIKLHYSEFDERPKEILLPAHIGDEALLEDFLNVKISVPERGEKRALLKLATDDSAELAKTLDERAIREIERKDALKAALSRVIEYASEINGSIPMTIPDDDDREYRIEAYDISNLNGLDTVGAMVVYEGNKPIRKDYRKFKIRTAEGDDYGSLREVIYRRLKRARNGDEGFKILPDILMIDGGLGQVHAVKAVVDAFRIAIPVVGMAKDDAHRTKSLVFDDGHEIELKDDRLLFSYCGNIQEEVHRFAITYMSGVRGKKMTHSVLEDIPGIGPKRRAELLKHFGSIEAIRTASYDDLMQVEGMTGKVAESVIDFLK
ncbi:MAG: excinuclease ABC subunit UvrC [Clostridiales bacterium]|nr:excinuclease ABC subunit UvrC [Candidatus Crickella caballi]